MNRTERRAAKRGPKPNACRRLDGVFTDGQRRYVWTLDNGSALVHDHRDGQCPFGRGGKYEGRAELRALDEVNNGCGCGVCGETMTFEDLFGFSEEQADAVFNWVEADDDTVEFDNASDRLIELDIEPERALDIMRVMVDKGLVVTLCLDCAAKHADELPFGGRWIHYVEH